jgi:hypothetical protein
MTYEFICQAVLVFLGILITDFLNALYVKYIAKEKNLHSASVSFFMIIFSGLVILEYTRNPLLIIPAAIGGFIGTLLSSYVKIKKP